MSRGGLACALAACGPASSSPPAPLPPSATIALGPGWPGALPAAVATELDRAAETHRVLAFGEGDHYVAEKYAYRLALLRPLVERHRLRHVAIEMGGSDAARIDRYLETGDEQWLRRVVLYGYSGETDDERRELAPVTRGERRPCDDAWARAERQFFRDLRALGASTGDRIHLFGFDYDAAPGGGYADARRAMEACTDDGVTRDVRAALTPPRNTNIDAEVRRLEMLVARIDGSREVLDGACGASAVSMARDALDQLAFSYRTMFEWRASAADTSPGGAARMTRMFAARENGMAARFTRWIASVPADSRVALLGHNLHVARDSERLRYGLAPHDQPMWTSLGTSIERDRAKSIWVSWLLYGRGTRYAPPKPEAISQVELRAESLEAHLAATPGASFVAVSRVPPDSVVDRPMPFGTESSEGSGPVRNASDAIVFLPTASAPPGCVRTP
ncbi:MAG: erythromycin esterase family protein [Labilithrix sp.]|nr:erythromycin esterase family protein [Labilithrix sp.]